MPRGHSAGAYVRLFGHVGFECQLMLYGLIFFLENYKLRTSLVPFFPNIFHTYVS